MTPITFISELAYLWKILEILQNLAKFIENSALGLRIIVEFLSNVIWSSFEPSFLLVPREIYPSEKE